MNRRSELSSSKRGPSYVVEELKRAIHLGRLGEGEQLPSTRELASRFSASLSTINSALRSLRAEGLIDYQPRRRARVAAIPKNSGGSPRQIAIVAPSFVSADAEGDVVETMRASRDSWSWGISHAAEAVWHQAGFHITTLPYFVNRDDAVDLLLSQLKKLGGGLAGLLCFPVPNVKAVTDSMDAQNTPWVTINAPNRRSVYNFVEADNVGGGLCVSRCFASQGIERVLVLSSTSELNQKLSEIAKISGLCQGFIEQGVPVQGIEVVSCDGWFDEYGYQTTLEYLKRTSKPPQAIYSIGDLLAIGGMRACQEHGLSVPGDVAVIGCTGLEISSHTNPSLTTLDQPMEHIGTQAAGMLLEMIREEIRRTVGRRIPSPVSFRQSMVVDDDVRQQIEKEYRSEMKSLGVVDLSAIEMSVK